MTIRDIDKYVSRLWDWGILDGCFGPTIKPTDIDGVVEKNGQFLFIEAKGLGIDIPLGQQIMYKQMARKGMSVLIIWGETNCPNYAQLFSTHYPNGSEISPTNLEEIRRICKTWYQWACTKR